jgi:dihydrodipicolinate synthase/N-acetylneuraminate lyase
VKRALYRMGLMVDGLRLPLTPLSAAADVRLAEVLRTVLPWEKKEEARKAASGRRVFTHRAA